MTADLNALADRIEKSMKDSAQYDEGSIFDLYPEDQPMVIAALRLAASQQSPVSSAPVAWVFELAAAINDDGTYCSWRKPEVSLTKPHVPEGSIRNLRPLYYPVISKRTREILGRAYEFVSDRKAHDGDIEADVIMREIDTALLPSSSAPASQSGNVRHTVVNECADFLAREYPDNANTNAFCAAIRSLSAPAQPADTKSEQIDDNYGDCAFQKSMREYETFISSGESDPSVKSGWPVADAAQLDRETLLAGLVEKFPIIFTPYGAGTKPSALAGRVVDYILSLQSNTKPGGGES